MPEMVPSASYTVHGITAPDACSPSRRSISLRMSPARGTLVYQSFHSSPSLTASVSPSRWSCDKGSSRAYGPLSDTGSSQDITFSLSVIACDKREAFAQGSASDEAIQSYFAVLDCFASLAMTKIAICCRGSLVQKIQRQARPRPVHRDQLALAGQRDIGGLQLGPAEDEVGGDTVASRHLFDDTDIRGDHRNAARDQGRHADVAGSFHRKRIEHLVAAEACDRLAALAAIDHVARLDGTRLGDFVSPEPRGRRLRDVDRILVWRQPDSVGRQHAVHDLDDLLHTGLEIVESPDIHLASATLDEIGEPQAAMPVEHQIVRASQRMRAAFVDDRLHLAALHIDPLDGTAEIVFRLRSRHDHVAGRDPAKAAIVADVAFAVGSDRRAIGAARNFRDHLLATFGPYSGQPLPSDFNQHHRSVRHHHRPFRKFEIGGENADIGHEILPAFPAAGGFQVHSARATLSFRCAELWQSRYRLPSNHRYVAAQGSPACGLFLDGDPDLKTAIAGQRIEILVVALEVGRIGRFQAGRRQPVIPDRIDGAPNGRDVVAVGEDRVFLFGDAHTAEFARQIGEVGHFDAGDVVEIAGVVAIAAYAVRHLPDPVGNVLHRLVKAMPLAGNASAAILGSDTFAETGDQKRLAGLETRRLKVIDCG